MDSIEKAMLGRSSAVSIPLVPRPTVVNQEDSIERTVGITKEQPSLRVSEPAANKRTQRSVTLDMERMRAGGLLTVDAHYNRIKEEYRHIKRTLLMNVDGKGATIADHPNLIGITSAHPREGKTFTACNLALSIAAERNRTVLLVDADILKPAVTKMMGFEADRGLVDFLIDDRLDLADVLVSTNIPALTILPAGGSHHLSAELLTSENMRRMIAEMSERYPDRIIIFDTPPLLPTIEARILASLMGQLIMVVEAEKTLQSHVREALAMLNSDQIVGFVLNKTREMLTSTNKPYDYNYRYARGEDEGLGIR